MSIIRKSLNKSGNIGRLQYRRALQALNVFLIVCFKFTEDPLLFHNIFGIIFYTQGGKY